MDKPNIFRENTDFNICKSWLCDSTDGQTYSISDWFGKKIIPCPETISRITYENILENCFCTQEWEDSIGWKHDYTVDDPEVDEVASKMADDLNRYIEGLNEKIRNAKDEPPAKYASAATSGYIMSAICDIFTYAIPNEYASKIANVIAEDVAKDVNETADLEEWNQDDVRLAVGRVLCKRLGISV